MTKPTCLVCGAGTDAYLCVNCGLRLEKLIAEFPSLIHDLEVTAARQGNVGNTVRPTAIPIELMQVETLEQGKIPARLRSTQGKNTLPPTPLPFSPSAAGLHSEAVTAVLTWARHLAETRGIEIPASPISRRVTEHRAVVGEADELIESCTWTWQRAPITVEVVCTWLVAHIDSIRLDEAAATMLRDFENLTGRAEATIDRHEPEVFAGRCDVQMVRLWPNRDGNHSEMIPEVRPCGTDLLTGKTDEKVECPRCGAVYDVAERRDQMRTQLANSLRRPAEIASALTSLDEPVKVDTLYKWIERDKAVMDQLRSGDRRTPPDYPMIVEQALDDGGHSLYRVGDVQARVAVMRGRAEARKSA